MQCRQVEIGVSALDQLGERLAGNRFVTLPLLQRVERHIEGIELVLRFVLLARLDHGGGELRRIGGIGRNIVDEGHALRLAAQRKQSGKQGQGYGERQQRGKPALARSLGERRNQRDQRDDDQRCRQHWQRHVGRRNRLHQGHGHVGKAGQRFPKSGTCTEHGDGEPQDAQQRKGESKASETGAIGHRCE